MTDEHDIKISQSWLEGFVVEAEQSGVHSESDIADLIKNASRLDLAQSNPAYMQGYDEEMEKLGQGRVTPALANFIKRLTPAGRAAGAPAAAARGGAEFVDAPGMGDALRQYMRNRAVVPYRQPGALAPAEGAAVVGGGDAATSNLRRLFNQPIAAGADEAAIRAAEGRGSYGGLLGGRPELKILGPEAEVIAQRRLAQQAAEAVPAAAEAVPAAVAGGAAIPAAAEAVPAAVAGGRAAGGAAAGAGSAVAAGKDPATLGNALKWLFMRDPLRAAAATAGTIGGASLIPWDHWNSSPQQRAMAEKLIEISQMDDALLQQQAMQALQSGNNRAAMELLRADKIKVRSADEFSDDYPSYYNRYSY
jgi:hypothetical protein